VKSSNVINGELFNADAFTDELDEVESDVINYRFWSNDALFIQDYAVQFAFMTIQRWHCVIYVIQIIRRPKRR